MGFLVFYRFTSYYLWANPCSPSPPRLMQLCINISEVMTLKKEQWRESGFPNFAINMRTTCSTNCGGVPYRPQISRVPLGPQFYQAMKWHLIFPFLVYHLLMMIRSKRKLSLVQSCEKWGKHFGVGGVCKVPAVGLQQQTHRCSFSSWELMCVFPSQRRNAVVRPGWKVIANKIFFMELNNVTLHLPQGGLCSLELVINGPTPPPPCHPLSSSTQRGVVPWLACHQLRQCPCGALSSLLCWLANHQAPVFLTKNPPLHESLECSSLFSALGGLICIV